MKCIVLYHTKYGSTREYAEWIAKDAKCDLMDIKGAKHLDFSHYDTFIVGSGIYAGTVPGANFVLDNWDKLKGKKVIFFTVSGKEAQSSETKKSYNNSMPSNIRSKVKSFHLGGRIDFKRLGFFKSFFFKMAGIKEIDNVNKNSIKPIIMFLRSSKK